MLSSPIKNRRCEETFLFATILFHVSTLFISFFFFWDGGAQAVEHRRARRLPVDGAAAGDAALVGAGRRHGGHVPRRRRRPMPDDAALVRGGRPLGPPVPLLPVGLHAKFISTFIFFKITNHNWNYI